MLARSGPTADAPFPIPPVADDAAIPASEAPHLADAIRALALPHAGTDCSRMTGDAALALRMAEPAAVLWTRFLKFDAADPHWPDRDRFVLSAGHGGMLLHAVLRLTDHPGMHGAPAAAGASLGPAGQGLANGVGMALAERLLAARFGRSLVDHRTWVLCDHDDLADGLSQEAASIAGQLRLEKLAVLLDDTAPPERREETLRRFAALGWAARQVECGDTIQIAAALSVALRSRRPTLIACCAAGAPTLPPMPPGRTTRSLAKAWHEAGMRGAAPRRAWLKRLTRHPLRPDFERVSAGRLPDGLHERIGALKATLAETPAPYATEAAGQAILEGLAPSVPELFGGSAGALPLLELGPSIDPGNFAGRQFQWRGCGHAMAAAMNGMALHGGLIPSGGAALLAADGMRPALRQAAVNRLRVIHIAVHDSLASGAGGPACQPMEQLAGLRAMPNLFVFRPADGMEAVECWDLALRRSDGPSLLALSGRDTAPQRTDMPENRCARGGYVLAPPEAIGPTATLIASGAEVGLALAARALLVKDGIFATVVSLPCWELFATQDESYRSTVLGAGPRFGIEAASGFGWERWLGSDGVFIGMTGFGVGAPGTDPYQHFGLTPEAIALCVKKKLA